MRAIFLILAGACFVSACSSTGGPSVATTAAAPTPARAPSSQVATATKPGAPICKTFSTTGTRFTTTECRTQAEWNQIAADAQQQTHAYGIPH